AGHLARGLPSLIECDKELAPYLFVNLRSRLRDQNLRCIYLDGRPREADAQPGGFPHGLMGTMIAQLREAVRGAVERRVVVLPHLDLLTTSTGGLTAEAREVIPLLYENPELVWLGFKDPSFPLPKVIENLFPHRLSILGIGRNRLRHLVTQKESRKFGKPFNPWQLYKFVSGVNAVRLRKLLSTLEGEDYPADPKQAYRHLRLATLTGALEIPDIDLDRDIGGYAKVKKRLREEILDVLRKRDTATDADDVTRLEELIPRGMIFWGPPGTGKTYFAKAIATAIGAAVTIVSGPELKSKWVGESLPYEEPVFVIWNGRPMRVPIGELVETLTPDDDVQTWTVLDDGRARLAPVTGFLKHRGPDTIDVLVTETGRRVRVTGGHSLFVKQDGRLAEVFAEQVEPGVTRVAVPLRLVAPETTDRLNLLDLLGDRDDVRVIGYDDQLVAAVAELGADTVGTTVGVEVRRLTHKRRPPLTLAAYRRLRAASGRPSDPVGLSLYCWHRGKSLPAELPLTPDLGEFLGLWAADGCYANTGVRLASNVAQVGQIEALCRRLFGHVTRYSKLDSPNGVDLVINHTLLRYVMRDGLRLEDGSGRKRVPEVLFLAPKPVVAAFLRGYFTADGTFSGKYVEATTTNPELAADVATLLQYFGIAARLRTKPERTGAISYRVRFVWSRFLKIFADEIGFMDATRQDRLRAYIDGMTFRRDLQTPARHITNDVLWDLVVEKRREPYQREYVYDLSVPGTERFVAGFGNVLVHNSEENLRQIFHKARQSAPSIIVFDELDSFATARGTYTGSGVEHSMVNQLLTEMDGFHKEELVFVVGTTNFVEALDPALLRPGRFEFHLHIPFPEADDRRAILDIYNRKMKLQMTPEAVEYAVRRSGDYVLGQAAGTRYSGDHLNALCRSVARLRLRDNITGESKPDLVERAMTEWVDRPVMTAAEERVLATHEAGHAIVSLFCDHTPPIDRITIASEMQWSFGYVKFADPAHKYVRTVGFYLDQICVALGAREAERALLDDISMGATQDLQSATGIARELVEVQGLGGGDLGVVQFADMHSQHPAQRRAFLAEATLAAIDKRVAEVVEEQRKRAEAIVTENKALIELLRDTLLEKKTLDSKALGALIPKKPAANSGGVTQ
ncbi:MAG: AAA family ATPase, partial [Fimbriiglobus sp.]